jgi:hypothetical protein
VVTVPTEGNGKPISPSVDLGQQILITSTGIEPLILMSNYNLPLTWTNLTTSVQTLKFVSPPGVNPSPPIPPGGKWTYTAHDGGNLHFQTTFGFSGVVDLS